MKRTPEQHKIWLENKAINLAKYRSNTKLRREKRTLHQQTKRRNGAWEDSNSPTGWSQFCSYQPSFGQSTCQYPCNGDC